MATDPGTLAAVPTTNWAGNVTFTARRVHRPSTVDELRRLVARGEQVRALGTGHSFTPIADSPGELISVAALPPAIELDTDRSTVSVAAGVRYGDLATRLHAAGYALHNMASLPHISVGGACATGTHGSGDRHGNLATAVSAVEIVTADGDLVVLSRDADGDLFHGAVVGLGALGIVTRLTLAVMPAFQIRQYVYEDLPRERFDEHWAEIFASAYSVSLFTDWTGDRINQVWLKQLAEDRPPPRQWMGARLADGPRNPVAGVSAVNCNEQLGVPGPWYARLPHFRPELIPSSGAELQAEYLVPRHRAIDALDALDRIRDRIAAVLHISEIRTVAPDHLWMSPSYRRDCVAIHFTLIKDEAAVTPVLDAIEERLAPLEARPHWGKLFRIRPDVLSGRYERWADFVALIRRFDPMGKFRNPFTDRYFSL